MEKFENQDEPYAKWINDHDSGFVLNLKTSGATTPMVHTSRCGHLYPLVMGRRHTGTRSKLCSEDLSSIVAWAKQDGFSIEECSTCHPYTKKQ